MAILLFSIIFKFAVVEKFTLCRISRKLKDLQQKLLLILNQHLLKIIVLFLMLLARTKIFFQKNFALIYLICPSVCPSVRPVRLSCLSVAE